MNKQLNQIINSKKWMNLVKENVINTVGDDVLWDIENQNFQLIISKNKEVGFFTLKREFSEIDLVSHNGIQEDTHLNAKTDYEYEFRIWVIPLIFLDEIKSILEEVGNAKIKSITSDEVFLRALRENIKKQLNTLLLDVFDYNILKVLLGQYETKFYKERLNQVLDKYFDTIKLLDLYVSYYQNEKDTWLKEFKNNPTYKEIETYYVDEKDNVKYTYQSSFPEFMELVMQFENLDINIDTLNEYVELETKLIKMYNEINKYRYEILLKEKNQNDNSNKSN